MVPTAISTHLPCRVLTLCSRELLRGGQDPPVRQLTGPCLRHRHPSLAGRGESRAVAVTPPWPGPCSCLFLPFSLLLPVLGRDLGLFCCIRFKCGEATWAPAPCSMAQLVARWTETRSSDSCPPLISIFARVLQRNSFWVRHTHFQDAELLLREDPEIRQVL